MTAGGDAFEFATAGRIVVGPGRAAEFGPGVRGCGTRVLVCTGSRPDRHQELIAALGLPTELVTVPGEPTVDLVAAATETARRHGADVVVGIGGGSVIDVGKAAAMLLANGGGPLDYLEVVGHGRLIGRRSVPYVAVPTTAGTGAEVTANAVLASPAHGLKASLRSLLMLPSVAIVDPLLTVGCPPAVTAAGGLDALTQCLEPYVSVRANLLTDGFAREGLARAARGLRRAYEDGGDVPARTDMAVCSLLGGLALANAKLGVVHGFAGVLGGLVQAPHGLLCAALLAPVVESNVRALRARGRTSPALQRYEDAARLLTGRADAQVEDGIAWIRETAALLGVPHLGALGVSAGQADQVVATTAAASSTQGNPVVLTVEELYETFADALG